jgi:ribosomal protein L7/L12
MLDGKGKQVRRTAMTIAEILQQAKTLSGQERKELVKLLVDSLDVSEVAPVSSGVYLNYAD